MASSKSYPPKSDQFDAQFSIHSLTQIIRPKNLEVTEGESPSKNTLDLKNVESVVLEGIIRAFTKTNFKGNLPPIPVDSIVDERYGGKMPAAYKYIKEVPLLKATQAELLRYCGLKENSIAHKERLVAAIEKLGSESYHFYYDRLEYDDQGNPIKDKDGNWEKLEIESAGTLFNISKISKNGVFKNYEIEPSSVFLDQRATYFVFIRKKWREEILQAVEKIGKKRLRKTVASYTFRFIFFLYFQFEMKRRSSFNSKPYSINWTPQEIAKSIRMSDSMIKHKKKRDKVLEDAYEVAKESGYLASYKRGAYTDTLVLNHEMFYDPKNLVESGVYNKITQTESSRNEEGFSKDQQSIFEFFHSCRSKLDKLHEPPVGDHKLKEMSLISNLLKKRSVSEIKSVISWSNTNKFWISRLFDIKRLEKNFSEAYSVFSSSNQDNLEENRGWIEGIKKKIEKNLANHQISIELFNKYVELSYGGIAFFSIDYSNKEFKKSLEHQISKSGIELKQLD